MIEQVEFALRPYRRGFHLVTEEILDHLPDLPRQGVLHLFVKHTSCALSINENFDPSVRSDLAEAYNRLVPERAAYYTHTEEGDDDMPSHVKATLTGVSLSVPISEGRLNMGIWQGIYLCEFRNHGGARRIVATIWS